MKILIKNVSLLITCYFFKTKYLLLQIYLYINNNLIPFKLIKKISEDDNQ